MITYQETPFMDEEIYAILHPYVKQWFKSQFKEFSAPQKFGIIPIHNKENTLIFASTGSGKTLTAFTSIINELTFLAEAGQLENRIYCVYISPLKALSRDINVNLKEPLSAIKKIAKQNKKEIDIRVAVRTGDTSSSKKSAMLKTPPHILITTPESFAIVLTSPKFRNHLNKADWVIVDEIHSLASNKRGTHLSLSLERLNQSTNFTRIGLSATVAPLEEIAKFLVGKKDNDNYRDCKIVDAQFIKKMDLRVLSPVENLINTPHETTHIKMYELINQLVQSHRTTLIFTNTRSATERVVHNLKEKFPEQYTENIGEAKSKSLIGAHHGSLSASHRIRIESQLKNGELKCIVSSTSLELGIDIGYIDLVILLGSPKSVARAIQRIGRSGHKLHDTAKGRIVVLDRDDLVECSVLLKAAIEKKIDKISIPKNCLDVLSQQIYGMAIEKKQGIEEVFWTVKKSYPYETLKRQDFDEVINYLSGEYASLEDRNVYAKIWIDKETGMLGRRSKLARVMYMTNIGTIPDESYITVKLGEQIIGKLDEGFLERLKRGDVFVLGGETYEFLYSRGMIARVKSSSGRPPTVPSWFSEMLPLSFDLSLEIQKFRYYIEQQLKYKKSKEDILKFINEYLYVDTNGANSIYEYFKEQFSYSEIPHDKKLIIEHFKEDNRKYVVFHSLYGRRVNDVLSRAMAFAISRMEHRDVEITINDNGFMLSYTKNINVIKAVRNLSQSNLRKVMELALEKTEILKRRFRHCAARALMILRNYNGRKKSVGRQQVSSKLLLSAVKRISDDFPILKEARREVLEDLMDIQNAEFVLGNIKADNIQIREKFLDFPSPFSFNLIIQGYSDIFKIEDKTEFLKRMHEKVLARINSPEKKHETEPEFSYSKLWEKLQEEKRLKKVEDIEDLKQMAWNLDRVPMFAKEEIIKMIEGNTCIKKDVLDSIKKYRHEIEETWPEKLKKFVLKKANELDEKTILLKQLNKANRKERLDEDILLCIKRLIDGERNDFTSNFKNWLNDFLNGTIGYHWEKELVKFLMNAKNEIE
ncbi:ATP-dependent helicase [Candidatus Woesearchaeota archaeon]|nr:ATP-dependent helicase [Candidatus Woesearchaeota archaeon]